MAKYYNVTNTLEMDGVVTTKDHEYAFGSSGDFRITDESEAKRIEEKYPYLLVTPNDQRSRIHPMRMVHPGLPWARYDERGRRVPDEETE